MYPDLEGKVVFITGGANGIGKAIGEAYGQAKANIVLADINEQALQKTQEAFAQTYGPSMIQTLPMNSTVENDVQHAITNAYKHFGGIDILINNAGVMDNMEAADRVPDDTWEHVFNVNVTGTMRVTRKMLELFQQQQQGVIVNMASITGLTGGRGGLAYTASKHAVVGMTKNIAAHYADQHIRANAIAPSQVPTAITQSGKTPDTYGMKAATKGLNLMPRAGTSEEIAHIALFLGSEHASFLNGAVIPADGGWSAY
ncbi:3-ketoacyl-ACP reductase [Marinococcus halophilus]|uniref:3-ketoacyl-ACP reductase n=1 Tax=Marinococcus halophilus TaxID=1371 RepID=A0A510Y8G0_MARHA|nr:SDR family oxidoreductase [Marinococcus halophilus]OZT79612.1 3-ketoacyl-ACP reductase [Marinococcus halophilus]GEK59453.1 3-ketoacyl-ACP reductase [Marinococcus halophilus]